MTSPGWNIARPRPARYYIGFRVLWMILIGALLLGCVTEAIRHLGH